MNKLSQLKGIIQRYKRVIVIIAAVISFVASLITVLDYIGKMQGDDSTENEKSSANFYIVKLVLPARMSGAKILIDSQLAVIVKQTPTVVTVQVERKTTGHKFTVRKGEAVCTQPPQLIRENNVIIHPCQ